MECTTLIVKICTNYPQAIINMKLMKSTVLCTATMKENKGLLRKSYSDPEAEYYMM